MPMTDLELLAIQVATLYTHDADGRLRQVNEPSGRPAPRFFLGRAKEGSLCRCRHDLPADLARELERLVATGPVAADLRADPPCFARLCELLREHAPIQGIWRGPAYRFPGTLPGQPAAVVQVTAANGELLRANFADWLPDLEHIQPCLAVVRDGAAVAICCSARVGARAAEAGVETLEAWRGRGYAARVVAAWAAAVRERGLIPLYSTEWDNLASQGVARRLGLVLYGDDLGVE